MNFLTKYFNIIFISLIALFIIVFVNYKIDKVYNIGNSIIFSYPTKILDFAGEKLPNFQTNYLIKERFDKEFLNTSYNLYQFLLYIKRLPLYMPFIEEQLEKNNIPNDFKYLPIAESALRNDVVSSAGASGIWQFMPDTAKEYGLIVNNEIDERYNFKKSTIAAMKYLNHIHDVLGNWTLVAAGYNMGQNGIKNALIKQNVDNYYDLYLNEETSRYIFRILAIKYVLKDYELKKDKINQLIGGQYQKPNITTIKVGKIDDLKKRALENGYDYQIIKNLNMWILKDYLPNGEWEIDLIK
ncbi:lytic transglycosylase domain-containing protein [Candidatus Gracilibacteria bacterium]|nr:lytic transglycosylase domain-containing protein [Candidatus Gracilibacteria bacterium]